MSTHERSPFKADARFFKPPANPQEWYFEIWPDRGPKPQRTFLTPDVIVNVCRDGDAFKVGHSKLGHPVAYETLPDEQSAYDRCVQIHETGQ